MENIPLQKDKLDKLIKLTKHYNVFPIFLPNHLSKYEKHPVSELLDDLTNEVMSYLNILDEKDIRQIDKSLPSGISMMVDLPLPITSLTKDDLERLAVYYISSEIQKGYFSFKEAIKYDVTDSEVFNIYPELKNEFDDENLMVLSDKFKFFDGGIKYKDHILHYSQFLRRGYSSSPNYDFLGRFVSYYNQSKDKNSFRIAIDHSRIMPKEFYQRIVELDTWRGPPFDKSKIDDPKYVGLTIVKRNENSLFGLSNKLDRTEFFWSFRDEIKTFQIEEVSELEYIFEDYNFNKYVHSEWDIVNKKFRHLDAAVKIYLKQDYKARFLQQTPDVNKCYKKIKLWRIDGDIELENWIDMITFFFKGNEMIIEYFDPDEFEKMFELRVRDFKKWKELNSKST